MKIALAFLSATISTVVNGACPNLCSGHGSCGINGKGLSKRGVLASFLHSQHTKSLSY